MNSLYGFNTPTVEADSPDKCWDHEQLLWHPVLPGGPAGKACTAETKWALTNIKHNHGAASRLAR